MRIMSEAHAKEIFNGPGGVFFTTHWSIILVSQQADSPQSAQALEQLCRTYWPPLYAFARRRGHSPEEASDLTQAFFARLLDKNYLRSVERAKGKFRTFLLTSMERFMANEWSRSRRQKRGGAHLHLSLDEHQAETSYQASLVDTLTAEKVLARRWAVTVLEVTMSTLAGECDRAGKTSLFEGLKGTLDGERQAGTLSDIANRLGMSEGAVRIALHRLRRRFGELLRAEVGRTVSSPEEITEEIQELRNALRG